MSDKDIERAKKRELRRKQDKETFQYILRRMKVYWLVYIELAGIIILFEYLGSLSELDASEMHNLATYIPMVMLAVVVGSEATLWTIRVGLLKNGINPDTLKYYKDSKGDINGQ